MRTVNEVSKLAGVSVRTLHHYDAVGLLKPTEVTQAGYRLYNDAALRRLQNILLFRELEFPLKEIKTILDSPNFDASQALAQQIELLELKQKHIGQLISFAREIQKKGVKEMNFQVFDKSKIEQYKAEAKEKWGHTKAYQEFEQRQSKKGFDDAADQMMELFCQLGAMKDLPPADKAVQEKIGSLQNFITEHYYTCTKQILHGLGKMYVQDERFQKNIDKAGGDGTAEFVSRAIEVYCAE